MKTAILYDNFRFAVNAAASGSRNDSMLSPPGDVEIPTLLKIFTYLNEDEEFFIESRHKNGGVQSSAPPKRGPSKALQRAAQQGLQAMTELYDVLEPGMLRKGESEYFTGGYVLMSG